MKVVSREVKSKGGYLLRSNNCPRTHVTFQEKAVFSRALGKKSLIDVYFRGQWLSKHT